MDLIKEKKNCKNVQGSMDLIKEKIIVKKSRFYGFN